MLSIVRSQRIQIDQPFADVSVLDLVRRNDDDSLFGKFLLDGCVDNIDHVRMDLFQDKELKTWKKKEIILRVFLLVRGMKLILMDVKMDQ